MDRPFHPPHENNASLGQQTDDNDKWWPEDKLEEWKDKYNLLRYKIDGIGARPYDCHWCGSKHENLKSIVMHVNAKHARLGDKEYWKHGHKCEWKDCTQKKVYDNEIGLMVHLRLHTGERPYLCPHTGCTLQFSTRESNLSHQRPLHRVISRPIFIDVRTIADPEGAEDSVRSSNLEDIAEEVSIPRSVGSGGSESGEEGGGEDSDGSESESESEVELRRSARVPRPPPRELSEPPPKPAAPRKQTSKKELDLGKGPDTSLDQFATGSESESVLSEGVVIGRRGKQKRVMPVRRQPGLLPERPSSALSRSNRRREPSEESAPPSRAGEPPKKKQRLEEFEWQRTFAAPLTGPEKLRRVTRTFAGQKKKLQKYRSYLDRCRMDLAEVANRSNYLQSAHPDKDAFSKIRAGGDTLAQTLDLLIARCDAAILHLDNKVLPRLKQMADDEKKVPNKGGEGESVLGAAEDFERPMGEEESGGDNDSDEDEDNENGTDAGDSIDVRERFDEKEDDMDDTESRGFGDAEEGTEDREGSEASEDLVLQQMEAFEDAQAGAEDFDDDEDEDGEMGLEDSALGEEDSALDDDGDQSMLEGESEMGESNDVPEDDGESLEEEGASVEGDGSEME